MDPTTNSTELHHYLELGNAPIRFESVSQLTNVFFDDSNRQIFAVRSGGATGIVVKSPNDNDVLSFCMDDKGPIRSIKFSPDNQMLAVQRTETAVEFIGFTNGQPKLSDTVIYKGKSLIIGFIWIHVSEVAVISNNGIETFSINIDKKQTKTVKTMGNSVSWFSWCPIANLAVLASNDGQILTPFILKQGIITKLPKVEYCRTIPERDVTLAQIYGISAILILQQNLKTRHIEVVIFLLNGPGLTPRKSHTLELGRGGRFAMNIVDDLVVVHHQASETSLLFDIALKGEPSDDDVQMHLPVTPGKPLKPFSLKLPSLGFDSQTMNCELYSPNWVLFQPNIVIDAKLGCLWFVKLNLESLCFLITDPVRLVEFLLQRTNAHSVLVNMLKNLIGINYKNTTLSVIERVFNALNIVYKETVNAKLQSQIGNPSSSKTTTTLKHTPRVIIDQTDMCNIVFAGILDKDYIGNVLIIYLQSLAKHNISAQHDLSKMIITNLVNHNQYDTLQKLMSYSLIHDSKPLACFLLSLSNMDSSITQMALDMLYRLNADSIIVEVLLGQGKVVDALRLAKSLPGSDTLSARKYLESASKSNDPMVFHAVYSFFHQRNAAKKGSANNPKRKCEYF